jgi:hypothetical protein
VTARGAARLKDIAKRRIRREVRKKRRGRKLLDGVVDVARVTEWASSNKMRGNKKWKGGSSSFNRAVQSKQGVTKGTAQHSTAQQGGVGLV